MASISSAIALCIILLVIIEVSSSEAGAHGKKKVQNKRNLHLAMPMRKKHMKSEKRIRPLSSKKNHHKSATKHAGSGKIPVKPKWKKKHGKKELKKVQGHKIYRPKSQKRPKLAILTKHRKDKKSFHKRNNAKQLPKYKKRFSKIGNKKIGQRRTKFGRKKKFLGLKVQKFDAKKLMNEVSVKGKNDVPVNPKLPAKNTNTTRINKIQLLNPQVVKNNVPVKPNIPAKNTNSTHINQFQVLKPQVVKNDYETTFNTPSSTYSPVHKDESEILNAPVTSLPNVVSLNFKNDEKTIKFMEEVPTTNEPIFQTTLQHEQKTISHRETEKISTDLPKNDFSDFLNNSKFRNRSKAFHENFFHKNYSKVFKLKPKPSTKRTEVTTQLSIQDIMAMPEGIFSNMHCSYVANGTCYSEAAPSICHERDWAGNCINETSFFYYYNDKLEKIIVPPFHYIVTPRPGDFHKWFEYNRGIMRRCVVHKKQDGLIKDTCIEFSDVLRDMPVLSRKVIERYHGYYAGNGNNDNDLELALDAIENVLNGYGTCERVANKFPFFKQYFRQYAQPCLLG